MPFLLQQWDKRTESPILGVTYCAIFSAMLQKVKCSKYICIYFLAVWWKRAQVYTAPRAGNWRPRCSHKSPLSLPLYFKKSWKFIASSNTSAWSSYMAQVWDFWPLCACELHPSCSSGSLWSRCSNAKEKSQFPLSEAAVHAADGRRSPLQALIVQ